MPNLERKYARPTVDLMFKKIFGTAENTDCLISFLSSLLNLSIESLEIENSELPKLDFKSKGIRLDILAKLLSGDKVNIEVQVVDEGNIDVRALFYWSKVFHQQLPIGANYSILKPVYSVIILDFDWFPVEMSYLNKFVLKEKNSNKSMFQSSEMLEICFIELPKFKETTTVPTSKLERWVTFLKTQNDQILEDLCMIEPTLAKAVTELEFARMTPVQKREYQARMEALSDYVSGMSYNLEKGEAKGKAEGEAKGKAEGKAEGEAKGKAEGKAETLARQAQKRFPGVSQATLDAIHILNIKQLDEQLELILDYKTKKDLEKSIAAMKVKK